MTSVKYGGFYGWPFSYWGRHVDTRVKDQKPELVAKAVAPDYGLGAHVAALGLTFYDGTLLPEQYRGGAFIGLHGSWNREPRSGYKVIYVPFSGGKPSGQPRDVLTGFVNADGDAQGRPVGVAVDKIGALLVADDVGNTVWRVTPAATGAEPPASPPAASQSIFWIHQRSIWVFRTRPRRHRERGKIIHRNQDGERRCRFSFCPTSIMQFAMTSGASLWTVEVRPGVQPFTAVAREDRRGPALTLD